LVAIPWLNFTTGLHSRGSIREHHNKTQPQEIIRPWKSIEYGAIGLPKAASATTENKHIRLLLTFICLGAHTQLLKCTICPLICAIVLPHLSTGGENPKFAVPVNFHCNRIPSSQMTATCQGHHTRLQSFLLDIKVSDILLHMPCPSDFNLICQQSSIMHPLLSKRDREPVGGWSVTPTIDGGMPPHCSHFYLGHNQETLFVGSAVAHLSFHSPFLSLPVCLQQLDFLLPATAHIDL
jgi:hypothetical protein